MGRSFHDYNLAYRDAEDLGIEFCLHAIPIYDSPLSSACEYLHKKQPWQYVHPESNTQKRPPVSDGQLRQMLEEMRLAGARPPTRQPKRCKVDERSERWYAEHPEDGPYDI